MDALTEINSCITKKKFFYRLSWKTLLDVAVIKHTNAKQYFFLSYRALKRDCLGQYTQITQWQKKNWSAEKYLWLKKLNRSVSKRFGDFQFRTCSFNMLYYRKSLLQWVSVSTKSWYEIAKWHWQTVKQDAHYFFYFYFAYWKYTWKLITFCSLVANNIIKSCKLQSQKR